MCISLIKSTRTHVCDKILRSHPHLLLLSTKHKKYIQSSNEPKNLATPAKRAKRPSISDSVKELGGKVLSNVGNVVGNVSNVGSVVGNGSVHPLDESFATAASEDSSDSCDSSDSGDSNDSSDVVVRFPTDVEKEGTHTSNSKSARKSMKFRRRSTNETTETAESYSFIASAFKFRRCSTNGSAETAETAEIADSDDSVSSTGARVETWNKPEFEHSQCRPKKDNSQIRPILKKVAESRRHSSFESNSTESVEQQDPSNGIGRPRSISMKHGTLPENTISTRTSQDSSDRIKAKRRRRRLSHYYEVSTVEELREAILDKGMELRELKLNYSPPPSLSSSKKPHNLDVPATRTHGSSTDEMEPAQFDSSNPEAQAISNNSPFSHEVLTLISKRYRSGSTPISRAPDDNSKLALSIEGGGVRGAVSGGMAAAISYLGLSDVFDGIYGSSAGSIVGSYFVSRQLYLDVYTNVIPAGKDKFVNKKKIAGDVLRSMIKVTKDRHLSSRRDSSSDSSECVPFAAPARSGGLNTSFVLDTIMCPEKGLRPLDLESFSHNDAVQPLRIVSSAVDIETGELKTVCFGSKEGHFRDGFAKTESDETLSPDSKSLYPERTSAEADCHGRRQGLWACLQASMAVPGAAGSPIMVDLPSGANGETAKHFCYDAFCHEPIPFRSAVEEGATHVLALRSRPASFRPETKPTFYHNTMAPFYFRSNGMHSVAEFFEKGGQQYVAAEDILTLDQGLHSTEAIPVPPPGVLYAAPTPSNKVASSQSSNVDKSRETWNKAHLLPITVSSDAQELSTLSQDRNDILAGIRSGFAEAFNILAPIVGIDPTQGGLDGNAIAQLVFPDELPPCNKSVLESQVRLPGEKISNVSSKMQDFDMTFTSSDNSPKSADSCRRGSLFWGRRSLSVSNELTDTLVSFDKEC